MPTLWLRPFQLLYLIIVLFLYCLSTSQRLSLISSLNTFGQKWMVSRNVWDRLGIEQFLIVQTLYLLSIQNSVELQNPVESGPKAFYPRQRWP
jgi:hypothetical protein